MKDDDRFKIRKFIVKCDNCNGTGKNGNCDYCLGSGKLIVTTKNGDIPMNVIIEV